MTETRKLEKRKQESDVHIDWMMRRDMPKVLAIESVAFANPWTEDDFIRCLRQRNCVGKVARLGDDSVVAFMVYSLHENKIRLLNLAVHAEQRRQGIGCQMVEKLIGKLSQQRRNVIVTEVRETNLDAQLFLSATGFVATGVLKDFYDTTTEDAYTMQFRHGWESGG